jgi:hypothetical protein
MCIDASLCSFPVRFRMNDRPLACGLPADVITVGVGRRRRKARLVKIIPALRIFAIPPAVTGPVGRRRGWDFVVRLMDFVIAAGMPRRQNESIPVRLQRPRRRSHAGSLHQHGGAARPCRQVTIPHFLETYKYE